VIAHKGEHWYHDTFLPKIGPLTLVALPFAINCNVQLNGGEVQCFLLDALRIAVPLVICFAVQFLVSFAIGRWIANDYPRTTAIAFTAAGNTSELAIAVPSPRTV
jgi:ACR3 family arsenite transporter